MGKQFNIGRRTTQFDLLIAKLKFPSSMSFSLVISCIDDFVPYLVVRLLGFMTLFKKGLESMMIFRTQSRNGWG